MQQTNQELNKHQEFIFKSICGISIMVSFIGTLTNGLLLNNISLGLISGFASIFLSIIYYFTNSKNLNSSISLYIFITLIAINFAWFLTNGITGSTPFMFIIFAIVVSVIALKNYIRFLTLIGTNIFLLVLLQYYYPQSILHYSNLDLQKLDITFFTLLTIALSNLAVIFFKMESYKQQARLEHKNLKLEASRVALEKAKTKVEEAHRVKSDFLSVMSHEVRTPLNAIVGISNLLNQYQYDSSEKQKLVHALNNSTQDLLGLLNEVLDFNQLETGQINLEPTTINVRAFLKQIEDTYAPKAKENGNKLTINIASNVPTSIQLDEHKLNQVFDHLVSNAIRNTTHGKIIINLENKKTANNIAHLFFEIKNTGVTIPEQEHKDIFGTVTTTPRSNINITNRIGLGLSITDRLIRLMNSSIQVENIPNESTRFFFTIEAPIHQIETIAQTTNESSSKILLVEDNKTNVLVLTHFLKKWGIAYEVAWDGLEALYHYKKQSFQLILMDMQMPKMDGFEATEEIRKDNDSIPIIALTASATQHEKQRAQIAGVNDYITKPFDPKHLLKVIQKHMVA